MVSLFIISLAGVSLKGCGGDDAEEALTDQEHRDWIRFTEYILFPTSPYVDKSWIEKVPEEEVASNPIDFATETAAIQETYSRFYNAFNERDIKTISKNLYTLGGVEFAIYCGAGGRRSLSRPTVMSHIHDLWYNPDSQAACVPRKWGPNAVLTEFYIRPKNVRAPWTEASVKGFSSFGGTFSAPGETYIYLIKRRDTWVIQQLVSLSPDDASRYKGKPPLGKYFNNPKYKAP